MSDQLKSPDCQYETHVALAKEKGEEPTEPGRWKIENIVKLIRQNGTPDASMLTAEGQAAGSQRPPEKGAGAKGGVKPSDLAKVTGQEQPARSRSPLKNRGSD